MVKESIKFAQNRWGFNVLEVIVPFPTDEAKVKPLQEFVSLCANDWPKKDFSPGRKHPEQPHNYICSFRPHCQHASNYFADQTNYCNDSTTRHFDTD